MADIVVLVVIMVVLYLRVSVFAATMRRMS